VEPKIDIRLGMIDALLVHFLDLEYEAMEIVTMVDKFKENVSGLDDELLGIRDVFEEVLEQNEYLSTELKKAQAELKRGDV
jgi:regulator of replication initiation timing